MWSPVDGRPISTSPGTIVAPVDQPAALDDADDEAGEVVFAVGVEAGHLRGLAAEQRAPVLAARAAMPLTTCSATSGDSRPVAR